MAEIDGIKVVSSDGKEFTLRSDLVPHFDTIIRLNQERFDKPGSSGPLPLDVIASVLRTIFEWYEKRENLPSLDEENPELAAFDKEVLFPDNDYKRLAQILNKKFELNWKGRNWIIDSTLLDMLSYGYKFYNMGNQGKSCSLKLQFVEASPLELIARVYNIIATNVLKCEVLRRITSKLFANFLKGKSVEQLMEIFGVQNIAALDDALEWRREKLREKDREKEVKREKEKETKKEKEREKRRRK
ncbi:unnamed protein product [Enterobius vermicularis]|uniref:Skp1_POZ domain-containing protein n=1 Tax=Enterobius vermicularis TaxID=51028 RepID=A0A0N4UZB1_ENTVE|nr:unnamed protein product [Enterobius vermicularis]